jgi:hypothetical protein
MFLIMVEVNQFVRYLLCVDRSQEGERDRRVVSS